jgi:hypothetical protein
MVITIIGFGQEQCIYRIQPVDTEACLNDTAVFHAQVDTLFFENTFKFDWFYKLEGASDWIKIQNGDPFFVTNAGLSSTLKVSVGNTNTYLGCAFKCSVSDLYESQAATLTAINVIPFFAFAHVGDCFGDITHFWVANDRAEIESFDWKFSDGTEYINDEIYHMFAAPGDYTITLTATDVNGCTRSFENTVTIMELPQPEILFSKDVFCSDESNVSFYAAGTFSSYSWEIQGVDHTISSDTSEIVFNCDDNFPVGQYKVRLTVSDQEGCFNSVEKNFLVLSSKAPVDGYVAQKENNSNLLVLLINDQESSTFHWMRIDIATKLVLEEEITDKPYHLFDQSVPINTQLYKYAVEVMPAVSDCSAVFYLN